MRSPGQLHISAEPDLLKDAALHVKRNHSGFGSAHYAAKNFNKAYQRALSDCAITKDKSPEPRAQSVPVPCVRSHSSLLIFDDAFGINAAVAAYQQASGAEVGVQTDVLAATLEQKWSALAMSAELKASMQDLVVQMGFGPN